MKWTKKGLISLFIPVSITSSSPSWRKIASDQVKNVLYYGPSVSSDCNMLRTNPSGSSLKLAVDLWGISLSLSNFLPSPLSLSNTRYTIFTIAVLRAHRKHSSSAGETLAVCGAVVSHSSTWILSRYKKNWCFHSVRVDVNQQWVPVQAEITFTGRKPPKQVVKSDFRGRTSRDFLQITPSPTVNSRTASYPIHPDNPVSIWIPVFVPPPPPTRTHTLVCLFSSCLLPSKGAKNGLFSVSIEVSSIYKLLLLQRKRSPGTI